MQRAQGPTKRSIYVARIVLKIAAVLYVLTFSLLILHALLSGWDVLPLTLVPLLISLGYVQYKNSQIRNLKHIIRAQAAHIDAVQTALRFAVYHDLMNHIPKQENQEIVIDEDTHYIRGH